MSDHDPNLAPDPIDKAYADAEALLAEDAARAARRARVLAAVAAEAPTPLDTPKPVPRRLAWGRGGWLAAACVAGVSVVVASQVYKPFLTPQQPSPDRTVIAPPLARSPAPMPLIQAPPKPPSPPTMAVVPPPPPAQPRPPVAPPADMAAPSAVPAPLPDAVPPPPPLPIPPVPKPAPPSPPPPMQSVVVTAQRRTANPAAAPAADRAAVGETSVNEIVVTSERKADLSPAAKLRAAAASGRIDEIETLLAQGVAVDAADPAGQTALMIAVQARRPEAVAVLRRHGADPDLTNQSGQSARQMAAAIDDPGLNQALELGQ